LTRSRILREIEKMTFFCLLENVFCQFFFLLGNDDFTVC
jgi:hypothetical protein